MQPSPAGLWAEQNRHPTIGFSADHVVEALVDPSFLSAIRWTFGAEATVDGETAPGRSENRVAVTVDAIGEAAFAGQIAGFGNRVELVEAPEGVFRELTRVAAEQYGPGAV